MQSKNLFSSQELLFIEQHNLGLRLTQNSREAQHGGFGDAIPLSHLAGAKNIIEFITLANLENPDLNRLAKIYNEYKEADIKTNTCMPRLILSYASEYNIEDAKQRLKHLPTSKSELIFKSRRLILIPAEIKKLTQYYQQYQMFMPLKDVIKDAPTIAAEITRNFNEKLIGRLALNWDVYANCDDMDYLILTNQKETDLYKLGYDFNRYPLGKIGKRHFTGEQVVCQIMFLGGENRTQQGKAQLTDKILSAIRNYSPQQYIEPPNIRPNIMHQEIRQAIAMPEQIPSNTSLKFIPKSFISITLFGLLIIAMTKIIHSLLEESQTESNIQPVILGLGVIGLFGYMSMRPDIQTNTPNLNP